MIEIRFLADHPEVISTLVEWALVWAPDYYGRRTREDIAGDFWRESQKTGIPIRLIAFVDGALAGMVNLREMAMAGFPRYSPALGGLYVTPAHRNQGVATALVQGIMDLAQAEQHARIYVSTATAQGILERLGWEFVQNEWEGETQLVVYQYAP